MLAPLVLVPAAVSPLVAAKVAVVQDGDDELLRRVVDVEAAAQRARELLDGGQARDDRLLRGELRLARACLNLFNLLRPPSLGPLRERLLSLRRPPGATARTHSRSFFALFLLSFCSLHFCSLFSSILCFFFLFYIPKVAPGLQNPPQNRPQSLPEASSSQSFVFPGRLVMDSPPRSLVFELLCAPGPQQGSMRGSSL